MLISYAPPTSASLFWFYYNDFLATEPQVEQ